LHKLSPIVLSTGLFLTQNLPYFFYAKEVARAKNQGSGAEEN
jgi:hypothetical protein